MADNGSKPRIFVRDLLFLDVIKSTSFSEPKNSREINAEIEKRWNELFPDEQFPKMGVKTIIKHVADMKSSGLYNVKVHPNNRLGYYNVGEEKKNEEIKFLYISEVIIIATALYRSPDVSVDTLRRIMDCLENLVEVEGASYLLFLKRHMKRWGIPRKTTRDIRSTINKLWKNLTNNIIPKKVKFSYGNAKYIVSPYFFAWENDELYLIGGTAGQHLKNFKMVEIENLMLVDKEAEPIRKTADYLHYIPDEDFSGRDRGGLTIEFPLDRYIREHIYMASSETLPIEIEIYFRADMKDKILTQFGLIEENICFAEENWDGQKVFSTTITAQENDGLYQWLMQFGDRVKVISPKIVRDNLKQRFCKALNLLG
ncbi:MAG: WYL domain-containing protein [Selenomonadaceae bacterium]|nr:WYL domain-containing protein [Selenomonadaceae bacterium]